MKWIRFLDDKTETYVICARILEHRLVWKIKASQMNKIGSTISVYTDSRLNIEILVKFEGYHGKNRKYRKYSFIYMNGREKHVSYEFEISMTDISCIVTFADWAYHETKFNKLKKEWVDKAEKLKVGGKYQINTCETVERVYDNIADDWGHDEVTSVIDTYIKCVGIDMHNGKKIFIFSSMDRDIDMKFEILGEW